MADNDSIGGAPIGANGVGNGADEGPQLGLIAQYAKDLSFENPNAPAVYQNTEQPQIDIGINVQTGVVGQDVHEVVMKIDVKATTSAGVAFQIELAYAGLFGARNVPEEALTPFLYAEAPRLLFPFARAIIANAVRDGNFPPLMLDPIDFGAMYAAQAGQASALASSEPVGQA